MGRRVVITGIGAVTSLGVGAGLLHEKSVAGQSGIKNGKSLCSDFDGVKELGRREAFRLDRFCQLALVAAQEAMATAGWDDIPPVDHYRIPCIIGSAIGGLITLEDEIEKMRIGGSDDVSPMTVPKLMANAAAAQISMRHGLKGEAAAIVSACSGGAQAIVAGVRAIRAGEADAAVVGGAEAATSDFTAAIFTTAGALSPSGKSIPFSKDRDGFILGEGAGVLILEAADAAEERAATVLGEIAGYGVTSDAHHITAPEPTGAGASRAITDALQSAGATAEDVAYINAHGTGTHLNDATEIIAMRRALGDQFDNIPTSSSKSYLGHLLGAAGAVEAIATVQALRAKKLPPVCGLSEPDETFGKTDLLLESRDLPSGDHSALALSNSFGFGGHNVVLAIRA